MKSIIIEEAQMICHAGESPASALHAMQSGGVPPMESESIAGAQVPVARVSSPLPTPTPAEYATRTNALIQKCLEKLTPAHYGVAPERLGVVLGSSNAGIEEFHQAWRSGSPTPTDWQRLEPGNVAAFVAQSIGAKGPAYTISTACSSAAKSLASAARLLEAGVCDAVIAGGGDALCRFALEGFNALHLIAGQQCTPFMLNGGGINHGEGAALFVLTRRAPVHGDIELRGYGETADAHHMTTPDPSGTQAARAMQQALSMAHLAPEDIDYINMHGTGTDANDLMELNAITAVFHHQCPPCSSTKPFTGHCLGAAGAVEAALCVALLQANTDKLPLSAPEAVPSGYEHICFSPTARRPVKNCMSNSFAFGGNNISLILSRHD